MANRSYEDRSSRRNRNQSTYNPESWRSLEGRQEGGRRDEEYGERQSQESRFGGEDLDENRASFGNRGRFEGSQDDRNMEQNRWGGMRGGEQGGFGWSSGQSQYGHGQPWHGQGGSATQGGYPSKESWLGGNAYGQGWQNHGYGQMGNPGQSHFGQAGQGQSNFGQGHGYGQGNYGQGGFGQQGNLGQSYGGQSFGGQGGYGQSNYAGAPLGQGQGQSNFGQGGFNQGRFGNQGFDQNQRQRGRGPKGYTRSDERIKEDVCDCLSDGSLDASEVEVNVRNGEVTLTGSVSDRSTKWQIEEMIDRINGVKDVHNQVTIQRGHVGAAETPRTGVDNGKSDDKRSKTTVGTH